MNLLPLWRKACWGFFRPKNPTALAGFEPANLGTKGQHATPRPPKPSCLTYDIKYNSMGGGTCRIKATSVFYHITTAYHVKKFFPQTIVNNHNKTQVSEKSQCICARRALHCAGSPIQSNFRWHMWPVATQSQPPPTLDSQPIGYIVIVTSAPTYILLLTGGQGLCTHLA